MWMGPENGVRLQAVRCFCRTAELRSAGWAPAPTWAVLTPYICASEVTLPVLLLVVFYFLLIRPQNKRAKEQREMLSKIATGDEVATTGGILGKVTEVGEQFLTLEIASGVSVKLQKFQVSQVLPKGTVKSA